MEKRTIAAMDYYHLLNDLRALGAERIRLGTERIELILKSFEHPQNQFKTIHIVGTNGKGSTSKVLASIYEAANYRVGLFTSPDLTDVRERIQLNNMLIPKQTFAELGRLVLNKGQTLDIHLSYFECLTVIGFLYFKQEKVDIAIIEAGLGGRLDSTNVLNQPLAVIVTPITEDHQDLLGQTLAEISAEKVAVFKANCPVISAEQSLEVRKVIEKRAQQTKSPLNYVNIKNWTIGSIKQERREIIDSERKAYRIKLLGRYQYQNIALAKQIVKFLSNTLPVSEIQLKTGIENAVWPASYQLFSTKNLIIDGSHNSQGIQTLIDSLNKDFPDQPLRLGLSLLSTKCIEALFPLLHAVPIKQISCIIPIEVIGNKAYISPEVMLETLSKEKPNLLITIESLDSFLGNLPQSELSVLTGSLYTAGSALKRI